MYFAEITEVPDKCLPSSRNTAGHDDVSSWRCEQALQGTYTQKSHGRGTLSVYLFKVYADKLEWPTDQRRLCVAAGNDRAKLYSVCFAIAVKVSSDRGGVTPVAVDHLPFL